MNDIKIVTMQYREYCAPFQWYHVVFCTHCAKNEDLGWVGLNPHDFPHFDTLMQRQIQRKKT